MELRFRVCPGHGTVGGRYRQLMRQAAGAGRVHIQKMEGGLFVQVTPAIHADTQRKKA